jgi:hypothetical protein
MGTSGPSGAVAKRAGRVELGPYFIVPKGLVQGGIAGRIGPHATAVYIALCEHANRGKREDQNTVSVSDRALAADTGVAERTIRDILTKLIEKHLVRCERGAGQSYSYTLLPLTTAFIPIEDRPRQIKRRRALHAPKPRSNDIQMLVGVQQTLPDPSGKECRIHPARFADLFGKVC